MREAKNVAGCALLIFGIFAVYFLVTLLVVTKPRNFKTAPGIKIQIEQNLPLGSSVAQVKAFLDSEKISHEEQPDEKGLLLASIPDTSWVLFGESRIIITFAFQNGKLVRYSVVERTFRP